MCEQNHLAASFGAAAWIFGDTQTPRWSLFNFEQFALVLPCNMNMQYASSAPLEFLVHAVEVFYGGR